MPGQFKPAHHDRGDANTIGGYMAVHDRPAAFEGTDGFSYSVEILTDNTGDPARPIGAYVLFVKWARIGAQAPEGHLESDFLATGVTHHQARREVGAMTLSQIREVLNGLIANARSGASARRWWDVARDDSHEGET